jgi:hypothetical protein
MHVTPKDFNKKKRKGRQGRFRSDWMKEKLLPGEVSFVTSWQEKSAEAIVGTVTSRPGEIKAGREEVSQVLKG